MNNWEDGRLTVECSESDRLSSAREDQLLRDELVFNTRLIYVASCLSHALGSQ